MTPPGDDTRPVEFADVTLTVGFHELACRILSETRSVAGNLIDKERRFLALAAACPTAKGVILEIGSFKGLSTVILAKAAEAGDDTPVVAVDPFIHPKLGGAETGADGFRRNLRSLGVESRVEFHQEYSHQLAQGWTRPIRLLWVDGDHSYAGTRSDMSLFAPFLARGGIIAFHDTLGCIGPLRVFLEDVLLSSAFGPAGVCGSIGWAQYVGDGADAVRHETKKLDLYRRLSCLVPHIYTRGRNSRWGRFRYRWHRFRVPHGEVSPATWCATVRRAC